MLAMSLTRVLIAFFTTFQVDFLRNRLQVIGIDASSVAAQVGIGKRKPKKAAQKYWLLTHRSRYKE